MTQKGFVSLIILIILIVFIVLGFFVYKNGYNNNSIIKNTVRDNLSTVKSPAPTIDPTTYSWKKFENDFLGYVLLYPNDLKLLNENNYKGTIFLGIPGEIEILFPNPTACPIEIDNDGFCPLETGNEVKIFISASKAKIDRYEKYYTQDTFNSIYAESKNNLLIDGIPAVQFDEEREGSIEPSFSIITWFIKDDINYYAEITTKNPENKSLVEDYLKEYNQILSTLKFTQ